MTKQCEEEVEHGLREDFARVMTDPVGATISATELRESIRQGLTSGSSAELDMAEIKAVARQRRAREEVLPHGD